LALESVTVMIYGTAVPATRAWFQHGMGQRTNACSKRRPGAPVLQPDAGVGCGRDPEDRVPAARAAAGRQYTIRFTNTGAATITSVAISDTLPATITG